MKSKRVGSTLCLVLPSVFADPGLFLSCGVWSAYADVCEAIRGQNGVLPHVHSAYWKHPLLASAMVEGLYCVPYAVWIRETVKRSIPGRSSNRVPVSFSASNSLSRAYSFWCCCKENFSS